MIYVPLVIQKYIGSFGMSQDYLTQLIQLRNYLSLIDDTNAVKFVNYSSQVIDSLAEL